MKLKRAIQLLLCMCLIFCALAIVGLLVQNREPVSPPGLASLQRVDEHPLYVLRLPGDYGFKDFLKTGVRPGTTGSTASSPWACTVFGALDSNSEKILGRNFDWDDHPALLLFTDSPDGYASMSMVDISYLGYTDKGDIPISNRERLLQAPYLPFDGMNEKGLAVGMMAISDVQPDYDSHKVTLSSLNMIRLMLDYALNVDEAIALIEKYNVDFAGGPTVHYLIADAAGHSAMVEHQDTRSGGTLLILRNEQPWQVSTNFKFAAEKPKAANSSCWRYNLAYKTLAAANGKLVQGDAMNLLHDVSQPSTIWSVIYNLTTRTAQVVMDRRYDHVHTFSLAK